MQTPVKGDFVEFPDSSKCAPCTPLSVPWNQTRTLAEEDTMNVETLELNAVSEASESHKTPELLSLALDDLDLVGGGAVIGSLQ
jgi:hypothetical protein